jgi:hypothetical protein
MPIPEPIPQEEPNVAPASTDTNVIIDPGYVTPYDPRADPANYDPINGIYLKDPNVIGTALMYMAGAVVVSAAVPLIAATSPLDLLAALAGLSRLRVPEPAPGGAILVPDFGSLTTIENKPARAPKDDAPLDLGGLTGPVDTTVDTTTAEPSSGASSSPSAGEPNDIAPVDLSGTDSADALPSFEFTVDETQIAA